MFDCHFDTSACLLVAGEWSAWVNGTCSTTCGPGKLQRTRVCRNVLTGAVQSDCDGHDNETLDCNLGYCEGNLQMIY